LDKPSLQNPEESVTEWLGSGRWKSL
jgi:hypothetical protein